MCDCYRGRKLEGLTRCFTVTLCFANPVFDLMESSPIILDLLVPLNESRPRHLNVIVEYFIDYERYFPFILMHELITILISSLIIISTGAITLVYVEHTCAMLRIVR